MKPSSAQAIVAQLKPCPSSRESFRNMFGLFVKFDIFGSFLGLAAQRGRTKGLKGFFFIEKGTLRSGANRGT
jgi:hypothetical protein